MHSNNIEIGTFSVIKKLMLIGIPIALQNLLASSLNFLDGIMVGQLGEVALAAVGFGNQIFFMMLVFIFGIIATEIIFVAQFWGNNDLPNIRKTIGITMITGLTISVIIAVGCGLFSRQLARMFYQDPSVIQSSVEYLSIIVFCFPFVAVTFTYFNALKGIGVIKLPLTINIIAVLVNTGLNYCLIFGNFGFPQMGVRGAAIATLISRILESVLLVGITYFYKYAVAARLSEMFSFSKQLVTRFFKTGFPIISAEIFWALGGIIYYNRYSNMGTSIGASFTIVAAVESLMFVFAIGLSSASEIIQGNALGAGQLDQAWQNSKKIILFTSIFYILIVAGMALTAPFVSTVLNVDAEVRQLLTELILVSCVIFLFRGLNCVLGEGMLRPGGDSKPGFYANIVTIWLIGIPLTIPASSILGWPIIAVFSIRIIEEALKTIYFLHRYMSKVWVKNIVHDMKNA